LDIARRLNCKAAQLYDGDSSKRHIVYTSVGGDSPQRLLFESAQDLSNSKFSAILIGGGECAATNEHYRRNRISAPWGSVKVDEGFTNSGKSRFSSYSSEEGRYGLVKPVHFYSMLENSISHHSRRSEQQHQRDMGVLWSRVSEAAPSNEYAWCTLRRTLRSAQRAQ
jgi:acetyl-CoA C-acetyltransferase